jgi:acetoin utilization deacetylase AcuC-like enzyme
MIIVHDPRCTDYGSYLRPEQPARLLKTVPHLMAAHPNWTWIEPVAVTEADLLLGHTPEHLRRLRQPRDFDDDTPYFEGIAEHAVRAVGAALAATDAAIAGRGPAIALMRPPGHHATASQAMGFCYLNSIALAARYARERRGLERVAVWDFDAHHGNGTEAMLVDRPGILFASVHQVPGYPGTGHSSFSNCYNWPISPRTPREIHMQALEQSFDRVIAFRPDLVLVSAGFDAYAGDPITSMTLEQTDFATLGTWLRSSQIPAAAVLEGGYSAELPSLVDAFLKAWSKEGHGA